MMVASQERFSRGADCVGDRTFITLEDKCEPRKLCEAFQIDKY